MNKINSMHRKTGFSSQIPPEYFPSLTSSVKSDTNRETKGNFFNRIPSPLICLYSLLVHSRAGFNYKPLKSALLTPNHIYTFGRFLEISLPIRKLFMQNNSENNTIITSKVLLLTRRWGGFSA